MLCYFYILMCIQEIYFRIETCFLDILGFYHVPIVTDSSRDKFQKPATVQESYDKRVSSKRERQLAHLEEVDTYDEFPKNLSSKEQRKIAKPILVDSIAEKKIVQIGPKAETEDIRQMLKPKELKKRSLSGAIEEDEEFEIMEMDDKRKQRNGVEKGKKLFLGNMKEHLTSRLY